MFKKIISFISKYALYLAFIQAWLAVLGSLYYSEIQKLPPCLLCWYQRIFMYPLAVIFAVAIIRRDKNVPYYALPLSIIGALIALYHYIIQMTTLSNALTCTATEPCELIQVSLFGFITIPLLSFLGFLFISILMAIMVKYPIKK
ncbi:hypothetical protein A2164_03910 [Candidatus Curtissbacteria bacterium RBG_13_35_7]|uniref:2-oxoglutarate dehydrogenase n=1 Tax=Candidatus Curtissbacteria bacterium RBG_13_35_7 TaxID=1797705 RepID=A0A1F5G2L8_9BACT|nr:MAG: hypothetical protein A2164_03910 [Candidatus Curtissbacteria bacterium RBG_13_35_7]